MSLSSISHQTYLFFLLIGITHLISNTKNRSTILCIQDCSLVLCFHKFWIEVALMLCPVHFFRHSSFCEHMLCWSRYLVLVHIPPKKNYPKFLDFKLLQIHIFKYSVPSLYIAKFSSLQNKTVGMGLMNNGQLICKYQYLVQNTLLYSGIPQNKIFNLCRSANYDPCAFHCKLKSNTDYCLLSLELQLDNVKLDFMLNHISMAFLYAAIILKNMNTNSKVVRQLQR